MDRWSVSLVFLNVDKHGHLPCNVQLERLNTEQSCDKASWELKPENKKGDTLVERQYKKQAKPACWSVPLTT